MLHNTIIVTCLTGRMARRSSGPFLGALARRGAIEYQADLP
jgi:hypothetical protein